ncbi:MAG: HAMP domain-containing histidine kinase, partial [Candidatus Brocadiae bacterium]|nr:HAMP domain-containing histidine kinase [Candidatus Brocadiia bacterium]
SNAAAVEIARQRAWLGVALAALLAALAAGLGMSFRAVKREAELAQLKSDFVATVSHELKTPLALVRMYAETLTLGRVDGEDRRREYLEVILRESERLTGMIERILDFARIERGEGAWRPAPGDLAAAVRGIAEDYAARHALDLEIDVPAPARACFDPEALALALRNLLENAVRYSEGRPAIAVRVSVLGGAVRVAVEDRGIGVPPGERARIFERFYRAGDPRARGVKGTGLGLALVASVMEGHGGRARCEGRDGGGSRFVLEFPVSEGRR